LGPAQPHRHPRRPRHRGTTRRRRAANCGFSDGAWVTPAAPCRPPHRFVQPRNFRGYLQGCPHRGDSLIVDAKASGDPLGPSNRLAGRTSLQFRPVLFDSSGRPRRYKRPVASGRGCVYAPGPLHQF
jgi:hypothetical protein